MLPDGFTVNDNLCSPHKCRYSI